MGSGARVRLARYAVARCAAALAVGCVGLLAVAGPAAAAPDTPDATAAAETPSGTVTVTTSCAGGNDTVTFHNSTETSVHLLATNFGQPFKELDVSAGADASFVLTAAGAPYDISVVRADTAVVLFAFSGFPCPSRIDKSFRLTAGTTFTSPMICPSPVLSVTRSPAHGTARPVAVGSGSGVRYTPAAGFRGTDSLDYACSASANQFGTIRLTVVAAATTPPTTPPTTSAAPPAAAPIPPLLPAATTSPAPQPSAALPATGPSRLPQQLGVAAALLLVGSTALWLGRRRRSTPTGD
jgi:hypothetical protein